MTTQPCNNQQFLKASQEYSEISEEKFSETHGTSQEMIMMQLSSEQTSLSNSSLSNISSEELSSIQKTKEEDPEFILTGHKQRAQQEISSILDLYDRDNPFPSGVSPEDVLKKQSPLDGWKKLNPKPYIAFADLNNSKDAPYENKPKPAIEIGLSWEF